MNGQLFAEYCRMANMLGLPPCSDMHWQNITGWLSEHVTKLAEWYCEQVRQSVRARGDQEAWVASYDGYYLTKGHCSTIRQQHCRLLHWQHCIVQTLH